MWRTTAPRPVSVTLALAASLWPLAPSAALSLSPAALGVYCTVTLHDFLGPRLVPVQPSVVTVNDDPDSAIVRGWGHYAVRHTAWEGTTNTRPEIDGYVGDRRVRIANVAREPRALWFWTVENGSLECG